MKKARPLAAALAVCLSLCLVPGARGEEAAELPEIPAVTVVGNRVQGDDAHFELSLRVSAAQFQSVGAVLRYDGAVLRPVNWSGTECPVTGKGWDQPAALPTKGADGLAGKPALACLGIGEEAGTDGYLYLGADSLTYTELDGVLAVTARFAYQEGKGPSDVTMPTREALEADPAGTVYTVDLCAEEGILERSIPGAPLVSTASADRVYQYGEAGTEGGEAYAPTFELTTGPSVNTGGGGGSGDWAVTFFDWDGRVIDAMSVGSGDVRSDVAAFEERQAARLGNKLGYAFDCWLRVTAGEGGLETANGVFPSNDAGLDRTDEQVKAAVEDFTNVTGNLLVQAAYRAKTADQGDKEDLVNGGLSANAARYYTLSDPVYDRYGAADEKNGQYSIQMTVRRANKADGRDYGVTRLRQPAVVVVMTPAAAGAQNLFSLIELENTDETTFELVPTKAISSVSYKVVDLYGVTNWPGASARSDPGAATDRGTFILQGTLGYLARQAEAAAGGAQWENDVNTATFADAGFPGIDMDRAKAALVTATQSKGGRLTNPEVTTALQGVSG